MRGAETDLKRNVTVVAGGLRLTVDGATGAWTRLVDDASGEVLLAGDPASVPLKATVGGTESSAPRRFTPRNLVRVTGAQTIGDRLRKVAHRVIDEGEAVTLVVEAQQDGWLITTRSTLSRYEPRIDRSFSLRYLGAGEILLREVTLGLPVLQAGATDVLDLPGAPVPPAIPVHQMQDRAIAVPDHGAALALAAMRNPASCRTVLCWAYSETEWPRLEVRGMAGGQGIGLSYSMPISARMTRDVEVSWGSDHVWLQRAPLPQVLRRFQGWWDEINVRTPVDRPRWIERALVYEVHVGTTIFDEGRLLYQPYPTIQSLIDDLDRIRALGFDTLEYMPMEPYVGYAVLDYYNTAAHFGDPAQLKALIDACHQRGMRIFLDWLIHGVTDKQVLRNVVDFISSAYTEDPRTDVLAEWMLNFADAWIEPAPEENPIRVQHPDWFMKNEDQSIAQCYTWAFDLEHPEVQRYIIDAMKHYVREFDIDGFRVDAPAWNQFANWDAQIPYRGSMTWTAGVRLLDRARKELRPLKRDLIMYTEPLSAPFRRAVDACYSYDEFFLIDGIMAWRDRAAVGGSSQEVFAGKYDKRRGGGIVLSPHQARVWFEHRRYALPKGSLTMHQVDSHDSWWWQPVGRRWRREQFGQAGYRALFFLFSTFAEGLMNFVGAEEGNEEFVSQVLGLRQSVPQLRDGRCDYLSVEVSDDSIFAVSWESEQGWAIPLTNLGPSEIDVTVSLPGDRFSWLRDAHYRVCDVFRGREVCGRPECTVRGEQLTGLTIRLPSMGYALVVIERVS